MHFEAGRMEPFQEGFNVRTIIAALFIGFYYASAPYIWGL